VHVLSFSAWWHYDDPANYSPDDGLAMRMSVLNAISGGITVVATVGNNQGKDLFPALMPEVIAVGGAAVTRKTAEPLDPEAWRGGSSFVYAGRPVPDVCGLASDIMLPIPPTVIPSGWKVGEGTSYSTPQVAGAVALLLQKQPGLSPASVKNTLQISAIDIKRGQSAMDPAGVGYDFATGYGLVNALAAWNKL
jgi:subtilisin family serine protease